MKKLCRLLAMFSPLLLVAASGCSPKEATQTVVEVWPDTPLKDLIQTVKVQAYGLPQLRVESDEPRMPVVWPVRRTFTPASKSASHRFRMVLSAFDANDKPVANFTLDADIIDEASHYVLVRVGDQCRPENCEAGICYALVDGADVDKSHQEAVCSGSAPADSPAVNITPSGDMTITGTGNTAPTGTGPGSMSTSTGTAANGGTGTMASGPVGPMASGQIGQDAGMVIAPPPVVRNDCTVDNGGCMGRCETVIGTGEATCTCQGETWLKGDGKGCADVQPEEILSTSSGSVQRTRPQVAFDSAGNGVVAWTEVSDNGMYTMWSARYSAATKSWTKPTGPFLPGSNNAADLHLALDGNGSGFLVWTASVNSHRQLWTTRYHSKDGFNVAETRRVDNATDSDVFMPALALDSAGDGLFAWTETVFPKGSLRVARYSASRDAFTMMPTLLGATSNSLVMNTSVALHSAESGLVAWTDVPVSTTPDGGIQVEQSIAFNATVGMDVGRRIGFDDGVAASTSPDVAVDAQGRGFAVWLRANSSTADSYTLLSSAYVSGSDWSSATPHVLADDVSFLAAPHIAVGADGSAFAVWRTRIGSDANARSLTRGALSVGSGFELAHDLGSMSDTATWNDIDTMNMSAETTITLIDQWQPHWDLAVGPQQTGFVVGASFDTSSSPAQRVLWLQRVVSSQEPAQPIRFTAADSVPARPSVPKIAMNANGDGAVVWDRQRDGRYFVYVSLLK